MEVLLYVYDLSHGLASEMSLQFLGTQIDAVYHTSIVFNNTEYFFGRGIQMCRAGMSHHGDPMEVVNLGTTNLPPEVIEEYLGALKETYTAESYDLFAHNCNNFSNDFSQFLVGKGIPEHITNLPRQVLNTPFGRMLQPQLDASMRSVTQAPVPAHAVQGSQQSTHPETPSHDTGHPHSRLEIVTLTKSIREYAMLEKLPDLMLFRRHFENDRTMQLALSFIERRTIQPRMNVTLPDLNSTFVRLSEISAECPAAMLMLILEITRALLWDLRVSTFAAERDWVRSWLSRLINRASEQSDEEHKFSRSIIRLVCNLFSSGLGRHCAISDVTLSPQVVELVAKNMLQQHDQVLQCLASMLAMNCATACLTDRLSINDSCNCNCGVSLADDKQVEMAVALIEVLGMDSATNQTIQLSIFALGRLLYKAPVDGDLLVTCTSLDAATAVRNRQPKLKPEEKNVVDEIERLLETSN